MLVESKDKTVQVYVTNVDNKELRVTQLDDGIMVTFYYKNPESGPTGWVNITMSEDTIYTLNYYDKLIQGGSISSPIRSTKTPQLYEVAAFRDTIRIEFNTPNKGETYFFIT